MRRFALAASIFAGFAAPASAATITALNLESQVVAAPARVADSQYGNTGIAQAFNERSDVTIASDMTLGGTFFEAGTSFDSHLIFHDRVEGSDYVTAEANFSFSKAIAAVIVYSQELYDTNALFGAAGSEYLSAGEWYGLEEQERNNLRVSEFEVFSRLVVNNGFDAVRVLTVAAVPVPAAGFMLLTALGLGAATRRKR